MRLEYFLLIDRIADLNLDAAAGARQAPAIRFLTRAGGSRDALFQGIEIDAMVGRIISR